MEVDNRVGDASALKDPAAVQATYGQVRDVLRDAFRSFDPSVRRRCFCHGPACKLYGDTFTDRRRNLMDVTGTTCWSWSRLGKGAGAAHKTFVPFFCWLMSMSLLLPELLIHECTERFYPGLIADILQGKYTIYTFLVNPLWFGNPFGRLRRITVCLLRGKLVLDAEPSDFYERFCRRVSLCVGDFCCAPAEEVEAFKRELASRELVCKDPVRSDWTEVLTLGETHRRIFWEEHFQSLHGRDASCTTFCADLEQREHFGRGGVFGPTFVTHGLHWVWSDQLGGASESQGRPMTGGEHLFASGWPVYPEFSGNTMCLLSGRMPWQLWGTHFQKKVAGNGFSLPALGTFFMWLFSSLKVATLPPPSAPLSLLAEAEEDSDPESTEMDGLLVRAF